MSKRRGPNGAGTVYQEKGRGWRAESYVPLPDGRRVRVKGRGETPEAARRAMHEAERRLLEQHPVAARMTVAQLSQQWIEARSPQWRASTRKSYETALEKHILPEIGKARVQLVTGLDVQRVMTKVRRKGDPVRGRATDNVALANRCRRVMHAMFQEAVRWQVVRVNPAAAVEKLPDAGRPRGWWTREEAGRFLEAVAGTRWHPLFHAALATGLRVGELLVLTWRDVTPEGVSVRRTYSQQAPGKIQNEPKTRTSRRTVPIPPSLRTELEGLRADPDDLVFPSETGVVLSQSHLRKVLIRYATAAGVPVIRLHDMRRTYASLLAEAGYHPSVIQRLLGHATPELAMRVYTSVRDGKLEEAVVELGGQTGGSPHGIERPPTVKMEDAEGEPLPPETLN